MLQMFNIGFYTNQNTYSLCLLLFKLVIFYILIYLYLLPASSNVMVELLILKNKLKADFRHMRLPKQ